jgi:hypothetical protein
VSKVYFIATKHEEYRDRVFEPGSIVIDPWRYIPERTGVTVRRIGQNRPAVISVLIPSRGRPDWFARMYTTLCNTATYPRQVEVIARLDDDDSTKVDYPWETAVHLKYAVGERCLLSEAWNDCLPWASGEIFMHCGDDLTFDTPGWDVMVRQAFAETPDKILFAYGNDLGPHGETFGTHGFVHRRWVETVGYFLPPLFSSDWNDVWLNEVAKMIGRHKLLPFVTEHHHYTFGKAERDQTHADREERGQRDDVVNLYKRTVKEREADAEKLRAVLAA